MLRAAVASAPGPASMYWALGFVRQVGYGCARGVRQRGHVPEPVLAMPAGIEDGAVTGGIAVSVGVNVALNRRILRRFKGVDGRELPVADQVLHGPVGVLEERQIVDGFDGYAMTAIQSRGAPVAGKVLEVLRTTRRQHRREDVCCRVVEGMAPGPGGLELQTIGEVAAELGLQVRCSWKLRSS